MIDPRPSETVVGTGPPLQAERGAATRAAEGQGPGWGRRRAGWLAGRSRATQVAFVLAVGYLLAALLGAYLVPYSPTDFNMGTILQRPSWKHPFGTDQFGRDILSRVVYGTGTILALSFTSTVLGVGAGILVGMASGYRGGLTDEIVMRAMDILMALPGLLLALLILTMLGPSKLNLVIGIAVVFIPKSARVARSGVLAVRNLGFVEAARLRGEPALSILLTEVLPNVREVLVVEFCLRFAYSLLLVSSLGFLGLGVQPPTPDWGLMVSEGRNFISVAPWLVLFPALAIGVLAVSVNVLADGLTRERRRLAVGHLV